MRMCGIDAPGRALSPSSASLFRRLLPCRARARRFCALFHAASSCAAAVLRRVVSPCCRDRGSASIRKRRVVVSVHGRGVDTRKRRGVEALRYRGASVSRRFVLCAASTTDERGSDDAARLGCNSPPVLGPLRRRSRVLVAASYAVPGSLDTGPAVCYTAGMEKLFDIIPPQCVVVSPSGCWEYQGRLDRNGRPADKPFGMPLFRFLVALRCGPPPSPEYHAAHKCHNRVCVNPEHGEWQTPDENNPKKHCDELGDKETVIVGGKTVTIKKRRSNKGDGRVITGWCAVFRVGNKSHKSGAYHSKSAAVSWAERKISGLNPHTT